MNKSALLLFICFLTILPTAVFSQKRDEKKEQLIENQLKAIDPSALKDFQLATIAMDEDRIVEADSLYSIVLSKAPEFDVVLRRLGQIKAQLGQVDEAIRLSEKAVALNRSSANLEMLASTYFFCAEKADQATARTYYTNATNILLEAKNLPDVELFDVYVLLAQTALNNNDLANFEQATNYLIREHSNQMLSHYFMAILAANNQNWKQAEKEIHLANKLGLPKEDMEKFLNSGIRRELTAEKRSIERAETQSQFTSIFLWVILVWGIGFFLLFIMGSILSKITLRTVEKQASSGDTSLQKGNTLRKFYQILINTSGFYYYISLPVVLIIVLVGSGLLIYGSLAIGVIPIKLLIILVIGVAVTIYGMLRSLFLRKGTLEPGRELKEAEAPELFALTKEVASKMNTRPIDAIRITPDTDLAVYETGSWRDKMRDNGKRTLIIGTGVLKDFKMDGFKAVLAHEYGHFANRDTAGGGVALRVQRDMFNYYVALYNAGQAAWWNGAFLFLRFYHFIFRRISAGATRLQEVLADRVAAQTYGTQSFVEGLTFVIRRDIEFSAKVNEEVKIADFEKRPYHNLFDLSAVGNTNVEAELEKALKRKTSEEDTHPSPVDRFRYVKAIGNNRPMQNEQSISDLFVNWNELTIEMSDRIGKIIAENKRIMAQQ